MADVAFTPKFTTPTPWVDARDRVEAGGPKGFNVRFENIAADMAALSNVVAQIDTALKALGQQPPPTEQRITLSPALVPVANVTAWNIDANGYAVRPINQPRVAGIMSVSLPPGATLKSLRVVGQNGGASALVRVALMRTTLLGTPEVAKLIVRVPGEGNPFDAQLAVDPALAAVDPNFRYFLHATVDNAASGDVIGLTGFQITYLPA
jgi:hypothetical protein